MPDRDIDKAEANEPEEAETGADTRTEEAREEKAEPGDKGKESFWTPKWIVALLGAIATVITAIGGILVVVLPPLIEGCRSSAASPTPPVAAIDDTARTPTSTPTERPTPTPPCGLHVGSKFTDVWNRDELGCPTESAGSIPAAWQPFEGGHMFWRDDQDLTYVLYDDSKRWESFEDTWDESQPEYTCPESSPSETPPTPKRGFGKAWCLESGVRERVGWAEETERGYSAIVQEFQEGLMVTSAENGIYILYSNHTWK